MLGQAGGIPVQYCTTLQQHRTRLLKSFPVQVCLFLGADVVLYGGWVERGIANVELMSKVWNKSKSCLPHFFLLEDTYL
jgi:hypothetical protein